MSELFGLSTLIISGVLLWIWEFRDPAQPIKYRAEFLKDFTAAVLSIASMLAVTYITLPVVNVIVSPAILESPVCLAVLALPLWLRVVIAYVLRDFTFYLMHWVMHASSLLWPTHQWHHSIRHVWWLSGKRTSMTCWFLYRFAPLWFVFLGLPPGIIAAILIHAGIHDNWVHLNIKPKPWMGVIEWVLVTPRYHRIHHYSPEARNLGSILTIFDRLFGTYANPDKFDFDDPDLDFIDGEIRVQTVLGI